MTGTDDLKPSAKKPQIEQEKVVAGVASYTFEPTVGLLAQECGLRLKRPAPHFVVESRSCSTIHRSARHQESSPAPSQISNSALTKPSKLALSSE